MKFKLIKSKKFTVGTVEHTHYTVAYKGRVFGLNSLRWEGTDIKVDANSVTVEGECELKKTESTDLLTGVVTSYIDIVPKLELVLAAC